MIRILILALKFGVLGLAALILLLSQSRTQSECGVNEFEGL